ncbi:MAG: hypothetical protein KF715_06975 [Candidatus Didemnitutus sp.]|nr:hypothetical protein [Candidatus Didemnitutus sp.]
MTVESTLFWLDRHPAAYWTVALTVSAALVIAALRPTFFPTPSSTQHHRRWLYPLLILLTLLAWRWPFLFFVDELNTDESQFIAGTLTLTRDPVFWRSVDGMTAGPLVYYALLPWTWLGIPLGYLTARVTGVLFVWASLWICYRLLQRVYGESTARLGLLPGVLFVASALAPDLNHYSSELASLPLTAIAFVLIMAASGTGPAAKWEWLGAGLAAGALPWAKLQTGPIGAVIILLGLGLILQMHQATPGAKLRAAAWLLGGCVLPSLLCATMVVSCGLEEDFYRRYILQNLHYTEQRSSPSWLFESIFNLRPASAGFLIYLLTSFLLAATVVGGRRRPGRIFLAAGLLLMVAIFCVALPKRDFLHYLWLLLLPLSIWCTAALGECRSPVALTSRIPARIALALVLVATVGILGTRVFAGRPPMLGQLGRLWQKPNTEVDSVVDLLTDRGDRLAVWGWRAQEFVKAGLIQGTRGAFSYWSIVPSAQRDYYRACHLQDMESQRPEVFIDSVGPNAIFFQNRLAEGHESFPALAQLVARDYRLVADLGYSRIYARRDVLARRQISAADVQTALAAGRPSQWIIRNLPRENLRAQNGRHDLFGGRDVLMMLPGSKAVWPLQGDEREVLFQCGYDPKAVQNGTSDGTGFEIELVAPDGTTRRLQQFLLLPAAGPEPDGVLRSSRQALPPYVPGSKLVIRTNPGPAGNDAWDWAYLTNVRFLRSPYFTFRQFPGFNRMPDSAESPLSTHVRNGGRETLLLHAPGKLGFVLSGAESRLELSFGFLPAAFDKSNGATFHIELSDPVGKILLHRRRQLDPQHVPAHRRRQSLAVDLPPTPAGSRLTVSVDPEGSNAFDWTYISQLRLD